MSNIRERRARRAANFKKTDELYEEVGIAIQEELDDTEIIQETISKKPRRKKAQKSLLQIDYDYQSMAKEFSQENVAQQLGNYRQAMDFLAHINPPKKGKIVDRFKDVIYDFPNIDMGSFVNIENARIYSWILQQMEYSLGEKYLGAIYVLGGGMGILPAMILDSGMRFETIRSVDINGTCQFLSDELMRDELLNDWRFKSTTEDLFNIDYAEHEFSCRLQNGSLSDPFKEIPGTIINTNVSYLKNYQDWYNMIPDMRRVVVVGQTGNVPKPFASSQAFNRKFPMNFEIYSGVLTVDDTQYYMKIGMK